MSEMQMRQWQAVNADARNFSGSSIGPGLIILILMIMGACVWLVT